VLSAFAGPEFEESSRVVQIREPGGFQMSGPAPPHLIAEMRNIMYDLAPEDLTREEALAILAAMRAARERVRAAQRPARVLHLVPR
jgi:hypothetical protein